MDQHQGHLYGQPNPAPSASANTGSGGTGGGHDGAPGDYTERNWWFRYRHSKVSYILINNQRIAIILNNYNLQSNIKDETILHN